MSPACGERIPLAVDTYYVDGRFVPAEQAVIPVNDLALLRGFGVFELIRTHGGHPFLLEEHLQRLEHSARRLHLPLTHDREALRQIVQQTLDRNRHLPEANIRVVVTGGPSADFTTPMGQSRLLVLISPLPAHPAWWYRQGVKIVLLTTERELTDAKSTNYLTATLAQHTAAERGAVEAVYMDRHGWVQEGTTSNLFAFIGEHLVTPGRGVLAGITRQAILRLAAASFSTQVRDLSRRELLSSDEVFITGTNKGIVPVVRVDEHIIGNGQPGPRTLQLMASLADYAAGRAAAAPRPNGNHAPACGTGGLARGDAGDDADRPGTHPDPQAIGPRHRP
jgi:branched-chain amino acid aminotransferase